MSVRTESRDGVLVITIDRPEARNAIDRPTAEGIAAALDTLDGAAEHAVGVITHGRTRSTPSADTSWAWSTGSPSRAARSPPRSSSPPRSWRTGAVAFAEKRPPVWRGR
jgi:1,4-dihydroxy-2-naphthoyl-CoA synthase